MADKIKEKWYGLFVGDNLISTRVGGHSDIKHWKEAIDFQLGRHPFSINTLIDTFLEKLEDLGDEETMSSTIYQDLEELKGEVLVWKELKGKPEFTLYEVQSIWEMDITQGRCNDNKIKRVY